MLEFDIGKREKQKAQTKLKIMKTFIKAMAGHPLNDLNIEDLCKEIGISKVTFFKYFRSKEEVVEYFILLWQYDMVYDINQKHLQGKEAIRYIFDNVSDHPSGHQIMIAIISYALKSTSATHMTISPYEYYLHNEGAYSANTDILSLDQILFRALETPSRSEAERLSLTQTLIAGFYGIPVIINLKASGSLKTTYRDLIESLF